ncbi:MAG: hypothetical protein E7311_05405 [Clostridiales bacterium]|nr:hypothetical protein [Clostridiales bacterium]
MEKRNRNINIFILIFLGLIAVLIILLISLFTTKNILSKEKDKIQQQQIQQEEEEKKYLISQFEKTKTYNVLNTKINNKNIYIDMGTDKYYDDNIIVAIKDEKIYVSNSGVDIISKDNNVYIINHKEKIISIKGNSQIVLDNIIKVPKENEIMKKGSKYVEHVKYDYEIIGNTQYYFMGNELKYIGEAETENYYKVNTVSEVIDEEIFNLPIDYAIIENDTISIENIIK